MLKNILIISAGIIIISLLAYRILLYSPAYSVKQEYRSSAEFEELASGSVNYIVSKDISGRIFMQTIDSVTAEKNFPFTKYNKKDYLGSIKDQRL